MRAFVSARHTSSTTHNVCLYPARFSPEIAKAVIEKFSEPNDWVLDPFMGGGSSVRTAPLSGSSLSVSAIES